MITSNRRARTIVEEREHHLDQHLGKKRTDQIARLRHGMELVSGNRDDPHGAISSSHQARASPRLSTQRR